MATSLLDPAQDQGQLLDSVRIKVSFDGPMVITGLRIMAQETGHHLGWIKQVNRLHYSLPASMGGDPSLELEVNTTDRIVFPIDVNGVSNRSMLYFTNTESKFLPIVTDAISLGGLQLDATRTGTDVIFRQLIYSTKFQMMLFGCKYEDHTAGTY